ncbi:MAG: serine/threonine protein kinase, partial [Stackebrandtia sp.]
MVDNGQVLRQRYRLVERIAVGGMGEVWRAEDLTLHRTVAIKVLHPGLAADPQFQQRFIQEARTLASLNAPGLIDLYDACEDPGPDDTTLSYLVMELVDAEPLSELLAEKARLEPDELLPILAQTATALQAAHGAGIVHRDIKPANILVAADGAVTVIDFGIARTSGGSQLTAAGSVIGTVEYASPEQLRGKQLTGASDVYSLGIVAYECLTGSPPFYGDAAAVINAQLNEEPPELPSDLPPEVARIVTKAVAKEPSQRFESAAAMAAACRASGSATRTMPVGRADAPAPATAQLDYEPPPEPEPEPVDRLLRKRTLTTVAITLGVVAVIAIAVGLVLWGGGGSGDPGSATSSSKSPKPSPTGPEAPGTSTLVSAANGKCVDIDFGIISDEVVLADCGDGTAKFEFESGPDDDVFKAKHADGEELCLNWKYGDDAVDPGDCS